MDISRDRHLQPVSVLSWKSIRATKPLSSPSPMSALWILRLQIFDSFAKTHVCRARFFLNVRGRRGAALLWALQRAARISSLNGKAPPGEERQTCSSVLVKPAGKHCPSVQRRWNFEMWLAVMFRPPYSGYGEGLSKKHQNSGGGFQKHKKKWKKRRGGFSKNKKNKKWMGFQKKRGRFIEKKTIRRRGVFKKKKECFSTIQKCVFQKTKRRVFQRTKKGRVSRTQKGVFPKYKMVSFSKNKRRVFQKKQKRVVFSSKNKNGFFFKKKT